MLIIKNHRLQDKPVKDVIGKRLLLFPNFLKLDAVVSSNRYTPSLELFEVKTMVSINFNHPAAKREKIMVSSPTVSMSITVPLLNPPPFLAEATENTKLTASPPLPAAPSTKKILQVQPTFTYPHKIFGHRIKNSSLI